ncbi:bifunctional DNA-formamidopyrimidine glycosylase/DNA-(apurinic or apyrimidinic site) lyase [Spirochaeta dissipatitropha]
MPELPEVHTTIESLRKAGIEGLEITGSYVERENTVGGDKQAFARAVQGMYIGPLQRRGKYILIPLLQMRPTDKPGDKSGAKPANLHGDKPGGWLQIHLRMSGRLFLADSYETAYVRAALALDDGRRLCLYAPRRFARMLYSADLADVESRLGVEPLSPDFSPELLGQLAAASRKPIKSFLLDQRRIAGVGNIYADEALFEASIHPLRTAQSLEPSELLGLHHAIIEVLNRGIGNLGTSLGHGKANFTLPDGNSGKNQEDIRVFRRTGLPCLRCGTIVERIIVGQRATHYCPRCQEYTN